MIGIHFWGSRIAAHITIYHPCYLLVCLWETDQSWWENKQELKRSVEEFEIIMQGLYKKSQVLSPNVWNNLVYTCKEIIIVFNF